MVIFNSKENSQTLFSLDHVDVVHYKVKFYFSDSRFIITFLMSHYCNDRFNAIDSFSNLTINYTIGTM